MTVESKATGSCRDCDDLRIALQYEEPLITKVEDFMHDIYQGVADAVSYYSYLARVRANTGSPTAEAVSQRLPRNDRTI